MRELAHRIVHARRFEYLLVFLILGSAIMQGVGISVLPEEIGTSDQPLEWFHYLIFTFAMFWLLTVVTLVLEALLKMIALSPRIDRYFRNGWNAFDFLAIGFLIISIAADHVPRQLRVSPHFGAPAATSPGSFDRSGPAVDPVYTVPLPTWPGTHSGPDGHRPLFVCSCWVLYFWRARPGKLGKFGRLHFVAVSNDDAG